MGKPTRKLSAVILNPDLGDDADDDPPTLCTPDDDGWVYLKRCDGSQPASKPPAKRTPSATKAKRSSGNGKRPR